MSLPTDNSYIDNQSFLQHIEKIHKGLESGSLVNKKLEVVSRWSLQWISDCFFAFFHFLQGRDIFSSYRTVAVLEGLTEYCLDKQDFFLSSRENFTLAKNSVKKVVDFFRNKTGMKYPNSFEKIDRVLQMEWPTFSWPDEASQQDGDAELFRLTPIQRRETETLIRSFAFSRTVGKKVEIRFFKKKEGAEVEKRVELRELEGGKRVGKSVELPCSIVFIDPQDGSLIPHILLCSKVNKLCHDILSGTILVRSLLDSTTSERLHHLPKSRKQLFNKAIQLIPIVRKKKEQTEDKKAYEENRLYPSTTKEAAAPSKTFVIYKQQVGDIGTFLKKKEEKPLVTISEASYFSQVYQQFCQIQKEWSERIFLFSSTNQSILTKLANLCEENSDIIVSLDPEWYLLKKMVRTLVQSIEKEASEAYENELKRIKKILGYGFPKIYWPSSAAPQLPGEPTLSPSELFSLTPSMKKRIANILQKYMFGRGIGLQLHLIFQESGTPQDKNWVPTSRTLLLYNATKEEAIDRIDNLPDSLLFYQNEGASLPSPILCSNMQVTPQAEKESDNDSPIEKKSKRSVGIGFDLIHNQWVVIKKNTRGLEKNNLQSLQTLQGEQKDCIESPLAFIGIRKVRAQKIYRDQCVFPPLQKEAASETRLIEKMYPGNLFALFGTNLSLSQKISIFSDLLQSLDTIHQQSITQESECLGEVSIYLSHGNIHPGNILIGRRGGNLPYYPVLSDFRTSLSLDNFVANPNWGSALAGVFAKKVSKMRREVSKMCGEGKDKAEIQKLRKEIQKLAKKYYVQYGRQDDVWMVGQILFSLLSGSPFYLGAAASFIFVEKTSNAEFTEMIEKELEQFDANNRLTKRYFSTDQENTDKEIGERLNQCRFNENEMRVVNQVILPMLQSDPDRRISLENAISELKEIQDNLGVESTD